MTIDLLYVVHNRLDYVRASLGTLAAHTNWERINRLDDLIEAQVTYAFHPRLGYLTACPTNVGTGMRVSVMLHLPALVITRQLERLFFENMNSSPALAYRRVRLERARHLLIQTKAPLIEIAVEVGFENASHFAKLFRKTYGQSPTTLRASLARNMVS